MIRKCDTDVNIIRERERDTVCVREGKECNTIITQSDFCYNNNIMMESNRLYSDILEQMKLLKGFYVWQVTPQDLHKKQLRGQ